MPQQPTQPTQSPAQPVPIVVQQLSAPQSPAEYRALIDRRDELMSQLGHAQGEHAQASVELQTGPSRNVASLQSRMRALESRIDRLHGEVDRTNDLILNTNPEVLAAARAENSATTQAAIDAGSRIAKEVIPLAGMFTVFFLFPIAIAVARLIWKRASGPARQPALPDAASMQRLDQLQQSVDAIAVEVERISEGQRYVAKVLVEKERPAIGA